MGGESVYYDTVECPYCGHENDMSDGCVDLPEDNKFDHECEKCGEEFEVEVELEPTYSANKIIYDTCECCGRKTRDSYKKGRVHPFPSIQESLLCPDCWRKTVVKEMYNN